MTREFILNTLLPYKEDPSTCGFDGEEEVCLYKTKNGNRCAVGKHMKEGVWLQQIANASDVFGEFKKENVLTHEALEQNLSNDIWEQMQKYHDSIALNIPVEKVNLGVQGLEELTDFKFPELYFNE